jgi:hypothetical protein
MTEILRNVSVLEGLSDDRFGADEVQRAQLFAEVAAASLA